MGQAIRRKVLVVEDEPELRHLAATVIEEADLDVVEVETADAALAFLQDHADEVVMVFTDVTLPGGGGRRRPHARLRGALAPHPGARHLRTRAAAEGWVAEDGAVPAQALAGAGCSGGCRQGRPWRRDPDDGPAASVTGTPARSGCFVPGWPEASDRLSRLLERRLLGIRWKKIGKGGAHRASLR